MTKKYPAQFYKKLPSTAKNAIYQGAMTLAAGFMAFDSLTVAGTGGGPVGLAGRLGALELAEDWILKIATDMAMKVQLNKSPKITNQDKDLNGGLIDSSDNDVSKEWLVDEDVDFSSTEPTPKQPTDENET